MTLTLNSDKFTKLFESAYGLLDSIDENRYADHTLNSKGITVIYCDSQYKKKIKLIVNPYRLLDTDKPNPEKLTRKLEKRISGYFNNKYQLDDFDLTGMALTTDIDVHSSENVFDYLKVLSRVGKVKGFSPFNSDWLENDTGLYFEGNSNGIQFMLYNLEALLSEQDSDEYFSIEQKSIPEDSEGLLQAEVKLTKPKAIREYTCKSSISKLIADLYHNRQQIFLETFMRVVPFGNFYKKDKAEEIIRTKVKDATVGA